MLGIHSTLHVAFKIPELELEQGEAREIAKAYADVAEHYSFLKIDPKFAAVANLCAAVSITYGSRITAYRLRMANERALRRAQSPQTAPFVEPTPAAPAANNGARRAMQTDATLRTGHVEGVGDVEFPPDHPLVKGTVQ